MDFPALVQTFGITGAIFVLVILSGRLRVWVYGWSYEKLEKDLADAKAEHAVEKAKWEAEEKTLRQERDVALERMWQAVTTTRQLTAVTEQLAGTPPGQAASSARTRR